MSRYHSDRSAASDPGRLRLSMEKLRWLQPEVFGWRALLVRYPWTGGKKLNGWKFRTMLAEHMNQGDSRAAVVVAIDPLLVAAYTDELDCIIPLRFPQWLVEDHQLQVGSRLLTVNTYGKRKKLSPDLIEGPASYRRWQQVYPIIAEFVCDDLDRIELRKRKIGEPEWQRAAALAKARLRQLQTIARDGRPLHSARPATAATA